ncbi:MAG: hypothetical protein ACFFCS_26500 [Candidatus Hodarchaeota archaeon]
MAAWKFLHESVRILRSISRARQSHVQDRVQEKNQDQDVQVIDGLGEEDDEDELEDEDDDLSDILALAHPA